LQAFVPGHELAINPPAWSLSAEMFFSLLFPLLAPPLFRLRSGTAVAAQVGLWLLSWLPGLLYLVLDPDGLSAAGIAVDHRAHAHPAHAQAAELVVHGGAVAGADCDDLCRSEPDRRQLCPAVSQGRVPE
jgi:peptidoglycan/LPS O-acetylase OafA/YrhL